MIDTTLAFLAAYAFPTLCAVTGAFGCLMFVMYVLQENDERREL